MRHQCFYFLYSKVQISHINPAIIFNMSKCFSTQVRTSVARALVRCSRWLSTEDKSGLDAGSAGSLNASHLPTLNFLLMQALSSASGSITSSSPSLHTLPLRVLHAATTIAPLDARAAFALATFETTRARLKLADIWYSSCLYLHEFKYFTNLLNYFIVQCCF